MYLNRLVHKILFLLLLTGRLTSNGSLTLSTGGQAVDNEFCDLVGDNFFEQFITGPVQHTHLLLCSCPEIISDVIASSPEQCGFPTDHHIIEFVVVLKFKRADAGSRHLYDYERRIFKDLCSLLSHFPFDMFVIVLSGNIDEYWAQWKGFFVNY